MRIAVLCNSPMALPAVGALLQNNALVGLGVPARETDATAQVKTIAEAHRIPLAVVLRQNSGVDLQQWIKQTRADAVFVLAFPFKILPDLLNLPRFGFFNFHPGALPHYRGPAPVFWQLVNREPHVGFTIHRMDADFDTGPVALVQQVPIVPGDTHGFLVSKLGFVAAQLALTLVDRLRTEGAQLALRAQDTENAGYQRRPDAADLCVDWTRSAEEIGALVAACNPTYGGAIVYFKGAPIRLHQVSVFSPEEPQDAPPGTVVAANPEQGVWVQCGCGALLHLDIVYSNDGFFTGHRLAALMDIRAGDVFTPAA